MITTCLTNAFYKDYFDTIAGHTLMLALYDVDATLDKDTTVYTTTGEIVQSGYTAGGQAITNVTSEQAGDNIFLSFDDVTWNPGVFTIGGMMIYDASNGNRAVAIVSTGTRNTLSPFVVTLTDFFLRVYN